MVRSFHSGILSLWPEDMLHLLSKLHCARCSQAVPAGVSGGVGAGLPLHGQEEEAARSEHEIFASARVESQPGSAHWGCSQWGTSKSTARKS